MRTKLPAGAKKESLNLTVSHSIKEQAAALAFEQGVSISELFSRLIEAESNKKAADEAKAARTAKRLNKVTRKPVKAIPEAPEKQVPAFAKGKN